MTTATAFDRLIDDPAVRATLPNAFDRAVIHLAVRMLKWSRMRAERVGLSHEEHLQRLRLQNQLVQRESAARRMSQYPGY